MKLTRRIGRVIENIQCADCISGTTPAALRVTLVNFDLGICSACTATQVGFAWMKVISISVDGTYYLSRAADYAPTVCRWRRDSAWPAGTVEIFEDSLCATSVSVNDMNLTIEVLGILSGSDISWRVCIWADDGPAAAPNLAIWQSTTLIGASPIDCTSDINPSGSGFACGTLYNFCGFSNVKPFCTEGSVVIEAIL